MHEWTNPIVVFTLASVLLENEFARTLKEKEELFSSTIEEMKAKLYETETRNKGTTCVILLILNDYV